MVSPHHLLKIATALSAVALTASVAVTPAYALQDIAIEDAVAQSGPVTADNGVVVQSDDQPDDQTGDQQSQDGMPDNPNAKLPDTVSDEISDDATVVSEDLAVTPEGEVKNIETGETVTDATLVGTQDQQPDPLAKTNGESFIPVSAEDVKNAVADANVQLSKFEGNEYGAHWGTYNNTKAFFDYQNNLFVQQAKGVIDVSEWQGDIDWAKAKADGVEGVIIRLGYGWGNNADKKAQRNISECKRFGIPFGIYWYSYAGTPSIAKEEGAGVVAKLKRFGVRASDLAYPVYYDLEKWTWKGHQPPTDPNVYNDIVNNWYGALQSAGYKNLGVYSYTSYLQGPLKHADIYAKTTWVAQYGARMGFDSFPTNSRGWQYTSSGKVGGIRGNVDMNAFGNKEYVNGGSSNDLQAAIDVRKMTAVTIPNGNYYINVRSKVASSVDIPGGSAADSTAIQLYSGNSSKAQQFTFTRQSDGSYEIVNVNSGKALDVRNGVAENNAVLEQEQRLKKNNSVEIHVPHGKRTARVDFGESPCVITDLKVNGIERHCWNNASLEMNGTYFFLDPDPQIVIDLGDSVNTRKSDTSLFVSANVYPLSGIPRDVEEHRIADINDLTENLKKIQGSRWWKLHEKMKPVISFARRMGQIVKRFVR